MFVFLLYNQFVSVYSRIFEQDERFTTTVAQKKLQDTGHTVKSSRQIIDEVAAVEILQSFLDQNGEYST